MIASLSLRLLGRKTTWRLGRALYLAAREEIANGIDSNGEARLAGDMLAAHRSASPGKTFLAFDIGANLGDWTQALLDQARPGDAVRVEMFEPVPRAFEAIERRFGGEARVHCNRLAISSAGGEGTMYIAGETAGTNSLTSQGADGLETIAVPLRTLEDHLAAIGEIGADLIKIDAEGHDIEILRSLRPLLARGALGVVQFEYNYRWLRSRGSLNEVFELIDEHPYRVARVTAGGLMVFEKWNAELDRYFEANYALVRSDLVAPLGAMGARWDDSNVAELMGTTAR
jgi:FkbM family methyltransferase